MCRQNMNAATYLVRLRKFIMRSAMKRPISPKMPPLAPTTGWHPLSSTALKNPPAIYMIAFRIR